jgi:tetratricopeptide (TPR) repeat protein
MFRRIRTVPLAAAVAAVACSSQPPPGSSAARAPLYDNLGAHHHPISTDSPDAQRFFDQGLTLSYAFNHAEAIRSFKQAIALDPECAMCFWGVAFALGPNINAPITEEAAKEAFAAIGQARMHGTGATDKERAYIEALGRRYAADPKADRVGLDRAYADAMRDVVKRFPDDLDAVTLFAQSMMDTSPWNYWDQNGNPRAFTNEVLSALESVLARKEDHTGAIHLYIHAVEASPDPGRAERYADRLASLVPGAGHLVHMPAHIYLRTGRYADASQANVDAVKVDEAYFAGDAVPGNMTYQIGYYPHNSHFLVMSASLEGRRDTALAAAEDVRSRVHADMIRDPAMGGMVQHMRLTPLFTKVRFSLWDQVLAEPAPPDDLPYTRAIWHTGRGLAYAAKGALKEADSELAALGALKDENSLTTLYVSSVNTGAAVVAIAYEVVAAEIATKRKNPAAAAKHYAQAVALEDALTYMEPPDWPIPVRQLQGAALLQLGRAREAEVAFRDDMKKFPENGWALTGLQESLVRQKKTAEAAEVAARLKKAWPGRN